MANISKITVLDGTTYDLKDTSKLPLAGGTLTGRVTTSKAINQIITGSGTAGKDNGSGTNRYQPAKWTFNTGLTASNGDIFTIKIPVAGHDYGVYLSIDNGSNYYPVSIGTNTRLTSQFAAGNYIQIIFDSSASATSMYALNGGTDRITVEGGCWRVLNYYDTGNTICQIRTENGRFYAGATGLSPYSLVCLDNNNKYSMLVSSGSGTGTSKTINTAGKFKLPAIILYYGANNTVGANTIAASTYNTFLAH